MMFGVSTWNNFAFEFAIPSQVSNPMVDIVQGQAKLLGVRRFENAKPS